MGKREISSYILWVIILLSPLLVFPYAYDYTLVKIVFTQFFLIIVFFWWLYESFVASGELVIYRHPAYLPLVLLFLWAVISVGFSPFTYASLNKLIEWSSYFLLYFLLINLTREDRFFAEVVLLVSVFALLSLSGFIWHLRTSSDNIISTLGNRNFFAAYLVLFLPMLLVFLVHSVVNRKFIILLLLTLLLFSTAFVLKVIGSVGSFLGLGASLLFLFFLYWDRVFWGRRKIPGIIVISLTCIFCGVFFLKSAPSIREFVAREMAQGTMGIRAYIWQGTWRMISQKFLTGWGLGTFPPVYSRFSPPEYFLHPHAAKVTQHAHNELLEIWSELGIIGLLLFLLLAVRVFREGIRVFWRNSNPLHRSIDGALLAGILGVLVQNLTGVNLRFPSMAVPFFTFLGLISAQSRGEMVTYKVKMGLPLRRKVFSVSLIPFILCLWGWKEKSFDYLLSSIYLKRGIEYRNKNLWYEAGENYRRALQKDPYNVEALYKLGFVYTQLQEWDKALDTYKSLSQLFPHYADLHSNLGFIYLKKGSLNKAEEELKNSLRFNPYHPPAHYLLGEIEREKGKTDVALKRYAKTIELEPRFLPAYIAIGDLLSSQGKSRNALHYYQKGLEHYPGNPTLLKRIEGIQLKN